MRRILFRWRNLTVWSYPAMLYVGLVAGVFVGNLAAHKTGADARRVFIATLVLIPPAIAGARLLYVAAHWSEYRDNTARIWNREEGGMAMYGGLPIMLLLSMPVLAALDLSFGAFWDIAVLTIMTGLALTKVGCLLNGCCAGRLSKSRAAVALANVRGECEQRLPVQVFESLWAVVMVAGGSLLLGRLPFDGALFLIVAGVYATGRMALESLREREHAAQRFDIGRTVSALTVACTAALLIVQWPR